MGTIPTQKNNWPEHDTRYAAEELLNSEMQILMGGNAPPHCQALCGICAICTSCTAVCTACTAVCTGCTLQSSLF